ncbi:MAG: hydroxymethylbilane synthase [Campylobacter sp.]|nr:hydroxymethylbilane synthase [Campylobacter sp.]
MGRLVIATRRSALAMWQSEFIKKEIENKHKISVELKPMQTKGDKILDTPLAKIGGKGLFTKELEVSMLNGESHIAVHSLKDVPMFFPEGLVLAAVTKREDERDAFVSQNFASFEDLPKGAVVGTTSLRRQMQLLILRPDLKIKSLRGNVNTRLKKLEDNEFDAIILANAGLKRLGLSARYVTPFSKEQMIPAMGQGILGIEAVENTQILEFLEFLVDEKALVESTIERDFVRILEGGCQVPIGINAELNDSKVMINAVLGLTDSSEIIKKSIVVSKDSYKTAGIDLANEFIAKGAKELLVRAEKMANKQQ